MRTNYILLLLLAFSGIAVATKAQTIPPYIPTSGLIGWWPFNGNANDESTNNNNGTNNGAVLTTDRFGNADSAYLFDGTSSYISIPSSASLESPTRGLTLSAWINLNGLSQVGQAFGPILTKSNSSFNGFMYRMDIDLNATAFYAGTNNWLNNIGVPYTFLLHQWYLVSAVLDSNTAYLYIDDTLINTLPYVTNINVNTLPLEIGRDVPGATEVFNGKLDDIGIWNRALSQQEIATIYNSINIGIKNVEKENSVSIYPNPATQKVNVRIEESRIGSIYNILDRSGRLVLTGKLVSKDTVIPLGNLAAGVYLLRIGEGLERTFTIVAN